MKQTNIKIEGMSCQHCAMRVKKAIDALPGVKESKVEIGSASVKYDEAAVSETAIEAAITKAGYKAAKG